MFESQTGKDERGECSYRGPALVGFRDSLRRTALAIKKIDKRRKRQGKNFAVKKIEERKEADIPWFMQKAIKPQHGTCSVHVGRRHPLESRKVPHLRHLLEWVLEAQAGK